MVCRCEGSGIKINEVRKRWNTDRVGLATQCRNPFFDFAFGRIEPIKECDNVLCLLSIDPVSVRIVGWMSGQNLCSCSRVGTVCLPSKVLVRLISPMMSFRNLLASKRDEVRLMLRRKDSKCLGSVRIVIFSVVDWGTSDSGACGRGSCASNMFRTFEIKRLQDGWVNTGKSNSTHRDVLLTDRRSCLSPVRRGTQKHTPQPLTTWSIIRFQKSGSDSISMIGYRTEHATISRTTILTAGLFASLSGRMEGSAFSTSSRRWLSSDCLVNVEERFSTAECSFPSPRAA